MTAGGVVAAGAAGTAQAGAQMLRRGGNAVDAVCAACFATAAYEPALTSLAGGGVMLVYEAADDNTTLIDFFSNAPGLGLDPPAQLDFAPVTVDFGAAKQVFHIGRGAVAIPSTLLGLGTALDRFGSLPLDQVVTPACAALRQGVRLDAFQARTFAMLAPILTHSASVRRHFAPMGRVLREGEVYRNDLIAQTLEACADVGPQRFWRERLTPLLVEAFGPARGGLLGEEDLGSYRVELRRPLGARYRQARLWTHAWPAHGGTMIAAMLALLEPFDLSVLVPGSTAHWRLVAAAQRVAEQIKASGDNPFDGAAMDRWHAHMQTQLEQPADAPPQPAGPGHTTHVSAMDSAGNAACVTISYGEGCGHAVGETGLVLNNFMGEADLHPLGFHKVPAGVRLATNMSPTLLEHRGCRYAMGSGGAERIRSALAQVQCNLVDFGMSPDQAVRAPRLHVEPGVLNAETFGGVEVDLHALAGSDRVVQSTEPNLFFGGVHLVGRTATGELLGAGDPRRSGAVVWVDETDSLAKPPA